jgi:Asp-tRNA(Asn)/Glu-tRNA(Gln) amidotransferase A subunit family amidase
MIPWLSAVELAELTARGRLAPSEVIDVMERRIQTIDDHLNAFITLTTELTRQRVQLVRRGKLAGVPAGLKDLIDVAGVPTTCGSTAVAARTPRVHADAWWRMEQEGALLLGKLNTQEFAAGVTSENDSYGPVRNPWDTRFVSGGSSGGSAAAVAAGLLALALGTDTGGSVRIPASFCGIVGLKPTTGLGSAAGVQPLAISLDQVGPLARSVRDASRCLDVIAGSQCEDAAIAGGHSRLDNARIAIPQPWLSGASTDVAEGFSEAVDLFVRCGADLLHVTELPDLEALTAINRILAYAEGSMVHEPNLRRGVQYGPLVHARFEAGRHITAVQYLRAQQLRRQASSALHEVWREADVLITPTVPCPPPLVGSSTACVGSKSHPVGNALVHFTAPFSLTGSPAITVPCGWDRGGLPLGLQIAGPPGADALVCFVAAAFETARNTHTQIRRPPGT